MSAWLEETLQFASAFNSMSSILAQSMHAIEDLAQTASVENVQLEAFRSHILRYKTQQVAIEAYVRKSCSISKISLLIQIAETSTCWSDFSWSLANGCSSWTNSCNFVAVRCWCMLCACNHNRSVAQQLPLVCERLAQTVSVQFEQWQQRLTKAPERVKEAIQWWIVILFICLVCGVVTTCC